MKKRMFVMALIVAISLSVATVLILYPRLARSDGAKPQGMEVRVDNFTFSPQTITVPVNSTVTWVNKDDIPHVIVTNDGLFRSKALDTDQEYSYTFTKAGTYPYYCSIHPKMVGKIVVQDRHAIMLGSVLLHPALPYVTTSLRGFELQMISEHQYKASATWPPCRDRQLARERTDSPVQGRIPPGFL